MSLRRLLNVFYALLTEGQEAAARVNIDLWLREPLDDGTDARTAEEKAAEEHRRHVQANAAGIASLQKLFKTMRPA